MKTLIDRIKMRWRLLLPIAILAVVNGICMFTVPNFSIPVGVTYLLVNIGVMLLCWRVGKRWQLHAAMAGMWTVHIHIIIDEKHECLSKSQVKGYDNAVTLAKNKADIQRQEWPERELYALLQGPSL